MRGLPPRNQKPQRWAAGIYLSTPSVAQALLPVRFCYAAILPILSLARYRTQRTQEDRLKPVPLKPKFKNAGQRPAVRNPTHSFASSSRAREAPLNLEHRQECLCYLKSKSPDAIPGLRLRRDLRCESNFGAVEWIRTTTVLLPPAPQAGASASSATTARADVAHLFRGEAFFARDHDYRRVSRRRQYPRFVFG
jgi:hypothetical protein